MKKTLTTVRQSSCIDSRVEARRARLVAKTGDDKELKVVTIDGKLVALLNEANRTMKQKPIFAPVNAPLLPRAFCCFRRCRKER